jgi:hypothetical protein
MTLNSAAIIALVIGLSVTSSCDRGSREMKTNASSVRGVLGLELPPWVMGAQFHSERAMGLLAYLRCEIPADRLDEFLRSSPIFPDVPVRSTEPVRFSSYNTTSPWWKPAELHAPTYREKTGQRGRWRTSSYLATEPRGGRLLVYFMYFEES